MVVGQPEVATTWYPVNDHPLDKATYTFRVTTPTRYGVVANGLPRTPDRDLARLDNARLGRALTPMASYLATIDIGTWDIRDRREGGRRIIDAVDPDLGGVADASLARQVGVHRLPRRRSSTTPIRSRPPARSSTTFLGFALENQTRPVYDPLFFLTGLGDTVVVHELAHQWFGDDIAVGRWQDIWLNEGFATYAEWLWAEHEGNATVEQQFLINYLFTPADDPFWELSIGDPGPAHLFAEPVYVRGAMTLQALRETVGDTDFFDILHTWADEQAGGNATTPEFIALAERVTGRQLDAFFHAWLDTGTRPALPVAAVAAGDAAQRAAAPDAWVAQWRAGLRERVERGTR